MCSQNDDDRKKYDRKNQVATSKHKEVSIQFRIPEKYVSAVIGKSGTVIKNIEELTNTRIKMEKEDTLSSERVCYVRSDNMENIHSAQNMIHGIIQNLPVIETYELFLPFEAAGKVFKKSNGFAQEIQKSYGAKVICENNAHEIASTYTIYIVRNDQYHLCVIVTIIILYRWIKKKDYIKRNC